MASERQVRANRLNAQKSTGPQTVQGKSISSRNAVRHGLTSLRVVVEGEDAALYEAMRRELVDEFQPATVLQASLVEQLAGIVWRLRRAAAYEPALLAWIAHLQSQAHDRHGVVLGQTFLPMGVMGLPKLDAIDCGTQAVSLSAPELLRTGRALEAAMGTKDLLGKLSRYECHLVRQLERVLKQIAGHETDGLRRPARAGFRQK